MSKFSTFFPPPPPPLHDHDHGGTDVPIPDDYFLDMNYLVNLDDQSSLGFHEVSHDDHDPDLQLEVDQRKASNNNPWFTKPPEVQFDFSSQQSVFSHQEMTSTGSTSSAGSSFDGSRPLMENYHMQEEFNNDKMKSTRSVVEFRTQTELETLDDGYRWRKYGKKKVKSNPNPRHYFKCSVEGCKVKKRVERDGEDSSYLVTGYDGKHNHESPCSNVVYCDRLPFLMLRPSQSNQQNHHF